MNVQMHERIILFAATALSGVKLREKLLVVPKLGRLYRLRYVRIFHRGAKGTLLGAALLLGASAQAATDLYQLSFEEVMSIEITSVAKKSQSLSEAAAAVYVITQEDIRRSGMTSIPELLRMVPGLHVASIDANKWAIASRGFNSRWSNKLLVLMDGRTLYTPLFSGVYWDVQDTPLEDIERIEVIRGPGGTLWGANAVNGVINIITKHSRDTQGLLLSARAGDNEQGGTLRYGGALGDAGWLRAYAKYDDYGSFPDEEGEKAHDSWDIQQAGFRADWELGHRDELTLQGDLYMGDAEQTVGTFQGAGVPGLYQQDSADLRGGNLLLHWRHTLDEVSDWEFKVYFDRTERDDITLEQRIDTFDLDFQHRFPLTGNQEMVWGLGYRRIEDSIDNSVTVLFDPDSRSQDLYSAFIQDEIRLGDQLRLTLGSKFEHNEYTGFEYQPSARLLWQVAEEHSLWGAVSRAVRTPTRSDSDIQINVTGFPAGPFPGQLSIFGSDNIVSEDLLAFELGYRGKPHQDLSLDVAAFYHQYDDLLSSESDEIFIAFPTPLALSSRTFENQLEGESYGVELAAIWQATSWWRLHAGYAWQQIDVRLDSTSTDETSVFTREESNPQHQFQLRSQWNLRHDLEFDASAYYVDGIELQGPGGEEVDLPSYTRLDARLGWRPAKNIEFSLAGQNLLQDRHAEFLTRDVISSEVPRTLYGQIKVQFE
jgi:iron complex outermembrane receptor protein